MDKLEILLKSNLSVTVITIALLFMAFDIVTGLSSAIATKSYKSSKMRLGLYHKLGFIFAIILCLLIEFTCEFINLGFNIPLLIPTTTYIIIMEIGSILENIKKINNNVLPKKIANVLEGENKNE